MSTFWDDRPPRVVKIHDFFFLNESFPKSFELIKVPEVWAHRPPPHQKKTYVN